MSVERGPVGTPIHDGSKAVSACHGQDVVTERIDAVMNALGYPNLGARHARPLRPEACWMNEADLRACCCQCEFGMPLVENVRGTERGFGCSMFLQVYGVREVRVMPDRHGLCEMYEGRAA